MSLTRASSLSCVLTAGSFAESRVKIHLSRKRPPMRLYINDVAVRDGFQMEKTFVPTATKVALIDQLSRTGLHKIEVTSFVSPRAVPALADANEVLAGIERVAGVVYVALVPNVRGVQNAAATARKPDELNGVMSASETHNRANINRTHEQSLAELPAMVRVAHEAGMKLTMSLSTTFGCPFEGRVSEDAVLRSWRRGVAGEPGPVPGEPVSFAGRAVAGAGRLAPVFADVRDRVFGYRLEVPNGTYAVTLQFVEGQIDRARGRVFDVLVQGHRALENVDIFAAAGKFRALERRVEGVAVADGRLTIDFADRIHYPALAGLVVEGPGFVRKINCGGPAVLDYEADAPPTARHLPALDLYEDWARAQFGPEAGPEAAAVFAEADGRHPVPVTWIGGPGNIQPDPRPWDEVAPSYAFVDALAAVGPKVAGPANRERFEYWLAQFRYMREVARFNGLWAVYNTAVAKAKAAGSEAGRREVLTSEALPVRIEMAVCLKRVFADLLANVSTTGELGTVANWEQHLLPGAWERPEAELAALLGTEIPAEARLSRDYDGPPRLVVPAVRTSLESGEAFSLKALVLARAEAGGVALFWRAMGRGEFVRVPFRHVARGVFEVRLPAPAGDIEYYVEAAADGRTVRFPVTAPDRAQTVVILPGVK